MPGAILTALPVPGWRVGVRHPSALPGVRWEPSTRTSTTSPQSQDLRRYRYLETANQNIRTTQPLFATDKTMEGSELYDWSSINLAAMNRYYHTTGTTRPTASASSIRGSLF